MTTPLPSVRVAWRPEQFNRVTNPGFETNTTGWSVSAGINAAGTSVTRITSDFHGGAASASVVCTATDGSGVNFDLGGDRYFDEGIYQATVWLRWVSGSRRARLILGSEGTSSDRATLEITELTDKWQPYTIRWVPVEHRTDAQLAVTNGSAEALTFLIDDVALYLVDGFSQVENGSFETDTTGWAATAGSFAAAATSITRTAGGFGGSYCGRVVVDAASATSGVTYDLGTRTFTSGRTYRLRVGAKTVSGAAEVALEWGRTPAGTDQTSQTVTLTSDFAWYTCDWTPSADRTTVELCVRSTTAAARTFDIDEVEVYEALDDLGTDAGGALRWSRSLTGIGSIVVTVNDADGEYSPRNSSAALYGSLEPGRMVWGRATYGNVLCPLFCGRLTTIEPQPWAGTTDLIGEDMLGDLRDARVAFDFDQTDEFYLARRYVIAAMTHGRSETNLSSGAARSDEARGSIEAAQFYNGTDGEVPALDYLADLNDATQSVHWAAPTVHATLPWRYTTQDRGTFSDITADFTIDETTPPTDIEGVRSTHEALENRIEVPWQGYEKLPPPSSDSTGFGIVVWGYDPDAYGDLGLGDEAPYISYLREEYGDDGDHPEARWRYPGGAKRWRRRRRRGLKVRRRTRIYPGRVLPFDMAAGDVRRFVFDFTVPVSGLIFDWDSSVDYTRFYSTVIEGRPNRLIVDLHCVTADTIDWIAVYGTPWRPLDDLTETWDDWESQALRGVRNADQIDTSYLPARGMAQGVGQYRTWRYGTPRLRPTLKDRNTFPRTLTMDLTDHIDLTADRWRLSAVPFVVSASSWEVTAGGLDWRAEHELDELPDHADWFVLDSSALDGSDVLAA